MNDQSTVAPILVRLGGLPCRFTAEFSSTLACHLPLIEERKSQLKATCAELVDRLYQAIHLSSSELRPILLALKRDCYNGRNLKQCQSIYQEHFGASEIDALFAKALELENEIEQFTTSFESSYDSEKERQYQALRAMLDHPMLRCGLAIASPTASGEMRRLTASDPGNYERKEKKLASTLLRYVSRAALKQSPFSTFTVVGLCQIEEGNHPVRLALGNWQYRSLLRLGRGTISRCVDLLGLSRSWRESLPLSLNDSMIELADGRTLLRRVERHRPNPENGIVEFERESLLRADFSGQIAERLKLLLKSRAIPYHEVASVLAAELSLMPSSVNEELDRLIDASFLCIVLPWSDHEGHVEAAILRELRRLPVETGLHEFCEHLEKFLALGQNLLESPDPAADYRGIHGCVDLLLRSAADAAGLGPEFDVSRRPTDKDIYQDVWCSPACDENEPIAFVGRSAVQAAAASVEPLLKVARIADHRRDFLYNLGALVFSGNTENQPVPLLEALSRSLGLWQEFVRFGLANAGKSPLRSTFNPNNFPFLCNLAQSRETARTTLLSCQIEKSDGWHVDLDALNAALAGIPEPFKNGYCGPCVHLQPANADGSLWVQNLLFEGTGRGGSRYTPLMPAAIRESYSDALIARSTFRLDGEDVPLLDVHCIYTGTLDVHTPQTAKVLVLPGTRVNIADERRLRLADLFVARGKDGMPELQDRSGQRYLPIRLGMSLDQFVPLSVKFICAFGPSGTLPVFPPPPAAQETGGIKSEQRTTIGNVVLRRKRWHVPVEQLLSILKGKSESGAFLALHGFLRQHGIPDKVFVIESVSHPGLTKRILKPQFLDLTSPLFLNLLCSMLPVAKTSITFLEMLPSPDLFPTGCNGESWAIELGLDSLALQPVKVQLNAQTHHYASMVGA
jgi:hypothetical protein